MIIKNLKPGDDPIDTSDNYNVNSPQWAIAGYLFKNYRRLTPYSVCNISEKYLAGEKKRTVRAL